MAVYKIIEFPDPRLRVVTKPIEAVDAHIQQVVDDLLETLYATNAIGLAATQVALTERIAVIDVSGNKSEPLVMINPDVTFLGEVVKMEEGCLSVPGCYETVKRHDRVKLKALGRDGAPYEIEAEGLLAEAIQHELDHLDGKLFIDLLSPLKRNRLKKKLEKIRRQGAE